MCWDQEFLFWTFEKTSNTVFSLDLPHSSNKNHVRVDLATMFHLKMALVMTTSKSFACWPLAHEVKSVTPVGSAGWPQPLYGGVTHDWLSSACCYNSYRFPCVTSFVGWRSRLPVSVSRPVSEHLAHSLCPARTWSSNSRVIIIISAAPLKMDLERFYTSFLDDFVTLYRY